MITTTGIDRYKELQKERFFFCRVKMIENKNGNPLKCFWESYHDEEKKIIFDLPKVERLNIWLFFVGNDISNDDDRKKGVVRFIIEDFNGNNPKHWLTLLQDFECNYKSRNDSFCHSTLFWALYNTSWDYNYFHKAYQRMSQGMRTVIWNYIKTNRGVLSISKQNRFGMEPMTVPDIESALQEVSPEKDFSDWGFFDKVDYIINYGQDFIEQDKLQTLYKTSHNPYINFKFWFDNPGLQRFNYNLLEYEDRYYYYIETMYTYASPDMQLSIVKRFLHDVRLEIIKKDNCLFNHIKNLRDLRNRPYFILRHYINNPGDKLDLVAPLFCDTLLSLHNTKGERLQEFEGLMDFAIKNSNKTYPGINLGYKRFIPQCDGGLRPNPQFCGFVHYTIEYVFDETKITDESLVETARFLLNNFATLQKEPFCLKSDVKKVEAKCWEKNTIVETKNNQKVEKKAPCQSIEWRPAIPNRWLKREDIAYRRALSLCIENVDSKNIISFEDVNFSKLRNNICSWAGKSKTLISENGKRPKELEENYYGYHTRNNEIIVKISRYIFDKFYKKTEMSIYPNKFIHFSDNTKRPKVWIDFGVPKFHEESNYIFDRIMEFLKEKYSDCKVFNDHITMPYNEKVYEDISALFYINDISSNDTIFLKQGQIRDGWFCTPRLSNANEIVSNLPFFWCDSKACFRNALEKQTLDMENDWRNYTLYHAAEIIGFPLIEKTKVGNVAKDAVKNFAWALHKMERLYKRLKCRSCGHLLYPEHGSFLNGTRFFYCMNPLCGEKEKEITLTFCSVCKKGVIDSRDSKKCPNGWIVCPDCLSCCYDKLFNSIRDGYIRDGRTVPLKIQQSIGHGHNDKDIFFCPRCGTQLVREEQKDEKGNILKDFKGDNLMVFKCPTCNKSFENEHKKYEDCTWRNNNFGDGN